MPCMRTARYVLLAILLPLHAFAWGSKGHAVIAELARSRGDRVAVIYERWLDAAGGVPPEWVRAGRWRVARNVVLGDRTVAFYAVDPTEAAALADHLRVFAPELPPGVAQMGPYTR